MTIPVRLDSKALDEQLRGLRDPEYVPLPQGVLGKTYFKCGIHPRWPVGKRLLLDGVDVTNRCNESDCVGGWARLMDIDAKGKVTGRFRTHYGKVEIIDPMYWSVSAPTYTGKIDVPMRVSV